MRLKHGWSVIVRKAWSIRLAALAAMFSAAEVILPMFADLIPRNLFAALSFVAIVGAAVARVIDQPEMHR